MAEIIGRGFLTTGKSHFDYNIEDLLLTEIGGTPLLLASSGRFGGLVSYRIDSKGGLTQVDAERYADSYDLGIAPELMSLEPIGKPRVLVGATSWGDYRTWSIRSDGTIGSRGALDASVEAPARPAGSVLTADGHMLTTALGGSGLTVFRSVYSTASDALRIGGSDGRLDQISSLATAEVGGRTVYLAASGRHDGLTAVMEQGGRLAVTGGIDARDGIAILEPTGVAVTEVLGRSYAVLSSSRTAGALTVMEITSDGELIPRDHVTDTLETRFMRAQSLDAIEIGGRSYLAVSGGDSGLSLFAVLPGGRLHHLDSIADSASQRLGGGITALTLGKSGGDLQIYAAASSEGGVNRLEWQPGAIGVQRKVGSGGGTLEGGSRGDILVGGAGKDHLKGFGGNDILVDSAGSDTLEGGSGSDVFVMVDDRGATDWIRGFDPARDRLDLSGVPLFYDPKSLEVDPTASGAVVTWYGERLIVSSHNGDPLTASQVRGAVLRDQPHRSLPAPARDVIGTEGSDSLQGGWGGDMLSGGGGNDTLFGGSGRDSLFGGSGDDLLQGGDDADEMDGGAGTDLLRGGSGNDSLSGGDGSDRLEGDAGRDRLYGRSGDDSLAGGTGRDRLLGGLDGDRLSGGGDDDLLWGESGADTLWGDEGSDRLYGGTWDDDLSGGHGIDWLHGEAGSDRLAGGDHGDSLYGGGEDDVIAGEGGDDLLLGGTGADRLSGGGGNDRLRGEDGADDLRGGRGADHMLGGADDDLLYGEHGNDTIYGEGGDDQARGGSGAERIYGGAGSDRLNGDDGGDLIFGDGGNDILDGGRHNDKLYGGPGDDGFYGGTGHDRIVGDDGSDRLYGGGGDDVLLGEADRDWIWGAGGDDVIYGGAGDDIVYAGSGEDVVYLGAGSDIFGPGSVLPDADRVHGEDGDDRLRSSPGGGYFTGAEGADTFFGGDGRDYIDGGSGDDRLRGGAGPDTFVFRPFSGADVIEGLQPGHDRLVFEDVAREDMTIKDHAEGTLLDWGTGSVMLEGIETARVTMDDLDF
ncbi:calcium-binding protein [Histidinibacterium aquaticum]|uniref:Calcium-binding protein n=1 Tax=Histidinibacterium aquaticum TaxID=2613962 RepID=A0A5J5GFA2_9RHOB|nr:calcium-binding protein [Histidinibacterium aquaticum]KAA9006791.1 calcium-binding protein [Histidinibacterium aquaticum]